MKRILCFGLCLLLFLGLIPRSAAAEMNAFSGLNAHIAPTEQITVENSVVRTSVTFENVTEARSCTLRWYINDTLCAEDRNFQLTEGAVSAFECSIHFRNDTPTVSVLWVEITANDESGDRAVFSRPLYTRSIGAAAKPDGGDYIIHVIRNHCVVIVYERDPSGEPGRVVNVFACSPGLNNWTITGRYTATSREKWLGLMGGVCGHYATLIWGDFLFHSVPYYGTDNGGLKPGEYNKLGEPASAGCIRMAVSDAKWIFDNCLSGTPVRLFDSDSLPVEKPVPIRISPDSPNPGWDPTDPHPENPTRAVSIPPLPEYLECPERSHGIDLTLPMTAR